MSVTIEQLDADDTIGAAWVEEAERRYQDVRVGRETGLPLAGSFAKMLARVPAIGCIT